MKKKILIIEDKEDFYKFLKENLIPRYTVLWARTAREGIEGLNLKPDLVILDMCFPREEGGICKIEIWHEILKKIKEYGFIKTIVVGSSENIDCKDVIKKGAFDCIPKIELIAGCEKLLNAIEKALGGDYEK